MCPACIATATWIIAGATSAGGLAALVVERLRDSRPEHPDSDRDALRLYAISDTSPEEPFTHIANRQEENQSWQRKFL
jgi:hypothetical protein